VPDRKNILSCPLKTRYTRHKDRTLRYVCSEKTTDPKDNTSRSVLLNTTANMATLKLCSNMIWGDLYGTRLRRSSDDHIVCQSIRSLSESLLFVFDDFHQNIFVLVCVACRVLLLYDNLYISHHVTTVLCPTNLKPTVMSWSDSPIFC